MPPTPNINVLKEATSRDFSGGLNVVDTELNLSSKYARALDNLLVGIDGSLQVRQGTKLFSTLSTLTEYEIVNMEYFYTRLICVDEIGQVFAVDGVGNATRLWDSAIAAAKRPGLTIWSNTRSCLFVEFNGDLIITNGRDKPLIVNSAFIVDYLADLATGSNINVPVALIIEKFSQHVVMAAGSMLYVSERNASGTWLNDVATQFANNFDMKTYVTKGSTDIIGIAVFKGYLLVRFQECIIPLQFVETPATGTDPATLTISVSPDSIIQNYGAISHRTQQEIGDSALSCDIVGVASIALSKFTRVLAPDRPSRLIDPLLQKALNSLSIDTLNTDSFSVYDRRMAMYMLFLPDSQHPYQLTSTAFCYRLVERLKVESWSRFTGWNWRCAARSSEGNIFFTRENSSDIFVLGNVDTNPLNADFVGDQETFTDGTVFTDQTGFGPVADVNDSGVPIKWAWELPWSDLKHRALSKTLRYIMMDTEGLARFNIKVFVDRVYEARSGGEEFSDGTTFTDNTGFNPFAEPDFMNALSLDMVASDRGGYGLDQYGDLYGGGNNTSTQLVTEAPTKFKIVKLRFEGESLEALRFVAITFLYQVGSLRSYGV